MSSYFQVPASLYQSLVTVLNAPTTTVITVTFILHSLFSSLARSMYISFSGFLSVLTLLLLLLLLLLLHNSVSISIPDLLTVIFPCFGVANKRTTCSKRPLWPLEEVPDRLGYVFSVEFSNMSRAQKELIKQLAGYCSHGTKATTSTVTSIGLQSNNFIFVNFLFLSYTEPVLSNLLYMYYPPSLQREETTFGQFFNWFECSFHSPRSVTLPRRKSPVYTIYIKLGRVEIDLSLPWTWA